MSCPRVGCLKIFEAAMIQWLSRKMEMFFSSLYQNGQPGEWTCVVNAKILAGRLGIFAA
jgi:hypothetical protein